VVSSIRSSPISIPKKPHIHVKKGMFCVPIIHVIRNGFFQPLVRPSRPILKRPATVEGGPPQFRVSHPADPISKKGIRNKSLEEVSDPPMKGIIKVV
jgi:hypothetical protein